jgi:hypothetical protein
MENSEQVIGYKNEWANFFKRHPEWPIIYNSLITTTKSIFIRKIDLSNLADKTVFFIGRLCVEDFNEIFLLCGNAYGFGALKILRGLYERTVTMAFIAANPNEAIAFQNFYYVQTRRTLSHAKDLIRDNNKIKKKIEEVEESYQKYKDDFTEFVCEKCKTTRIRYSWSKLDLASMARKVDLDRLYYFGYAFPTLQTHATLSSILERMKITEDNSISFNEGLQPEWADTALITAHDILINVFIIQNAHFKLKLESEIELRKNEFIKFWKK